MKEWAKDWVGELLMQHWSASDVQSLIERDEEVYTRLEWELNCDFGLGGGLNDDSLNFSMAFGTVLADLPKEAFLKLREMKNVFYTFVPLPMAMVKTFPLEEKLKAQSIVVVTFPHFLLMPEDALRGQIAHELAHVYLGHTQGGQKIEDEANNLVKEWGFHKEWEAWYTFEAEQFGEEIDRGVMDKL